VPDNLSERSKTLEVKGKIKKRSVIIFGTGDSLKVPTVSANAGFVRAAQHQVNLWMFNPTIFFLIIYLEFHVIELQQVQCLLSNRLLFSYKFQGVNFVAILHESRALTEAKEIHDESWREISLGHWYRVVVIVGN
jgi:hypothetical protein